MYKDLVGTKFKKSNIYVILKTYTEKVFIRVNYKNELYFSIISFRNEANRFCVSDIDIAVTLPKGLIFRSDGSVLRIFVPFSNACKTKGRYRGELWH